MERYVNPSKVQDGIVVFLEDAKELELNMLELMQVAKSIYLAVGVDLGIIKAEESEESEE